MSIASSPFSARLWIAQRCAQLGLGPATGGSVGWAKSWDWTELKELERRKH